MYAIFKKRDKQFIGFTHAISVDENSPYLYKDVGDTDPIKYKWHGDYDTGDIVSVDEESFVHDEKQLVILENEERQRTQDNILNKHKRPIYKQINYLYEQLNQICEDLGVKKCENFSDTYDIITAELEARKKRIKQYKENTDKYVYLTEENHNDFFLEELT